MEHLLSILRMLVQFDAGQTKDLRNTLEIPLDESDVEYIDIIADRWHSSLLEQEKRAKAIIQQLRHILDLTSSL